jgi:uncharacterized protein (TIGR02145 family)
MRDSFKYASFGFFILLCGLNSCRKKELPLLTTDPVTNITGSSATCGGNVTDEGSGPVINRGVCWKNSTNPTIDDEKRLADGGPGPFVCSLSHLNGSTKYYVRAYATNEAGTGYGSEISFTTAPAAINFSEWVTYGSLPDQDGNVYKTVKIGNQTWMAENLRSTHYQDGSPIPEVTDLNDWMLLTTGAYCFYNNDILNKNTYGAIYNWYTTSDQHKICPAGWHIPSDTEWTIMENFLGGSSTAGMDIKETGSGHWISPNAGATNLSGFTALPAGSRYLALNQDYLGMGYYCLWWSSTEFISSNTESAWFRALHVFNSGMERNTYWKFTGLSIRCVMD